MHQNIIYILCVCVCFIFDINKSRLLKNTKKNQIDIFLNEKHIKTKIIELSNTLNLVDTMFKIIDCLKLF